jgi:hypothetical protein
MAAPAYLLDTSILLRLSLSGGPYDEMVVSAVGRLVAAGATLFYTLQNAAEFWNVCTRPRERNGLGLPIREADRRLQLIEQQFSLLSETEAAYAQWRQIVMECGVSGVQVHDARLFFVETLADLEKKIQTGRTPEQVVGSIAYKTPELQASANVHHLSILVDELTGNLMIDVEHPKRVIGGGQLVMLAGAKGLIFRESPEQEAMRRWQRGEFLEIERNIASGWRRALSLVDQTALYASFKNLYSSLPKPKTLTELKALADAILAGSETDLKADLARLDAHYSALPDEVRNRGMMSFAPQPPEDDTFLTTRLWDKHLPNWRAEAAKPKEISKQMQGALLDLVKRFNERSTGLDPSTRIPMEEVAALTIESKVSLRKGKWRRFTSEVEAAAKEKFRSGEDE